MRPLYHLLALGSACALLPLAGHAMADTAACVPVHMAELHAARGDKALADALKAAAGTHRTTPACAATNQGTPTR